MKSFNRIVILFDILNEAHMQNLHFHYFDPQAYSCLYLNKKLMFCEMRATVNELWSKGEKVTCGVVTKDTRVQNS